VAKRRREPVRTCIACRQEAGKQSLIRVARTAGGDASVDLTGHASGRGAYLHQDPLCIEIARKRKALERALNTTVAPDFWAELSPALKPV
jgi:uncharacterized protein